MKHVWRLGIAICLVGALAALLGRSRCDLPLAEQLDDCALPAPLRVFHEEIELSQDLDEKLRGVVGRAAAREEIVARLLAGELTLFEAATRFRDLNAAAPEVTRNLQQRFPDLAPDHAVCRQVITFVEEELRRRAPERATAVVARLEDELAEHLRQHGRVCLPYSAR